MTEAFELRRKLEAELSKGAPRLGPLNEIQETAHVPGKPKPVKVTFRLTGRQGPRLFYSATCPRCRKGQITAETMLVAGKTQLPFAFPQLCEEICETALDLECQAA